MPQALFLMKKTFKSFFSGGNIKKSNVVSKSSNFLTFFVRISWSILFIVPDCKWIAHCFIFIFMKCCLKATLGTWGSLWQTLNLFQEGSKLVFQIMRACYSTYTCKDRLLFLLDLSHPKLWSQRNSMKKKTSFQSSTDNKSWKVWG